MSRKPIIAANWKMNLLIYAIRMFYNALNWILKSFWTICFFIIVALVCYFIWNFITKKRKTEDETKVQ